MSKQIIHIDAQPDIRKLVDLIKAVLNIPSSTEDTSESKHIEAAGELVQKIRPDAILLNIQAPGLDGEELFARAGSSASLNGIVQLLTLARSKAEIAEPGTREGCDAYITKEMGKIDPL